LVKKDSIYNYKAELTEVGTEVFWYSFTVSMF